MDLDTYESLSGVNVTSSRKTRISAYIERTRAMLEGMLGYTLDPEKADQNLYNEIGKTATNSLSLSWTPPAVEDLLPPDAVVGAYRLYNFDVRDDALMVDPFSAINAVKLVRNGITYYTFDAASYRAQAERDGLTRYIVLNPWLNAFRLQVLSEWLENGFQFAVDADWLWDDANAIPDRLQMVWADMVTYYADSGRLVRSQTTGTHSWSKFDDARTPPEKLEANAQVLRELAGPYGLLGKPLVA